MNPKRFAPIIAVLAAMCGVTHAAGLPDSTRIKADMRRAFDWQIQHLTTDKFPIDHNEGLRGWVHGAFLTGVMEAYRATQDTAYLEYAWNSAQQTAWQPGPRARHADDLIGAQTYIELAGIDPQKADLKPTLAVLGPLVESEHDGKKLLFWCDALYMLPPTLARLTQVTGDPKYVQAMHRLYWQAADYLYDPGERLFFRDKSYMPDDANFRPIIMVKEHPVRFLEANGRKMFWSRGNGWVFAGLARIMNCLPDDDPQRARYVALFQALAGRLLELQPEDGLWRMGLLDQSAYGHGEVSGSGFFLYGFAWGVNHGVLDEVTYRPAIEKGWRAMSQCQKPDGMIGYVQPIGSAPGKLDADSSQEYGTGAFLLAGSEILKLPDDAPTPQQKANPSPLTQP